MKSIIYTFSFLILITGLNAQERNVPEEEMSFDILKWHYSTYPNSEENKWTEINKDENYYRVRFKFKGHSFLVEYDSKGIITHEVVDLEDNIPVFIAHELDKYDKYKVNSFLKISDRKENTVMYKLDLKIKSEGQKVLWYDENFIQIPTTDFSKSITDLYR